MIRDIFAPALAALKTTAPVWEKTFLLLQCNFIKSLELICKFIPQLLKNNEVILNLQHNNRWMIYF